MRTFATAFVRAVTAIASRTAGSPSSDGTSPSGTSVNSATSGSARKVRATPAASARTPVNATDPAPARDARMTEGDLSTRREPEARAVQDPPAPVGPDAVDEG